MKQRWEVLICCFATGAERRITVSAASYAEAAQEAFARCYPKGTMRPTAPYERVRLFVADVKGFLSRSVFFVFVEPEDKEPQP